MRVAVAVARHVGVPRHARERPGLRLGARAAARAAPTAGRVPLRRRLLLGLLPVVLLVAARRDAHRRAGEQERAQRRRRLGARLLPLGQLPLPEELGVAPEEGSDDVEAHGALGQQLLDAQPRRVGLVVGQGDPQVAARPDERRGRAVGAEQPRVEAGVRLVRRGLRLGVAHAADVVVVPHPGAARRAKVEPATATAAVEAARAGARAAARALLRREPLEVARPAGRDADAAHHRLPRSAAREQVVELAARSRRRRRAGARPRRVVEPLLVAHLKVVGAALRTVHVRLGLEARHARRAGLVPNGLFKLQLLVHIHRLARFRRRGRHDNRRPAQCHACGARARVTVVSGGSVGSRRRSVAARLTVGRSRATRT